MPSDEAEELLGAHEVLWRRLNLYHVVPEGQGYRISSSAFCQTQHSQEDQGLSVQRAALISQEEIRSIFPREGLARITVAQVVSIGDGFFQVVATPNLDDPAHASIRPVPTGSKSDKLRKLATKVYDPDGVDEVRGIAETLSSEQGKTINQVWNEAVRRYQASRREQEQGQ